MGRCGPPRPFFGGRDCTRTRARESGVVVYRRGAAHGGSLSASLMIPSRAATTSLRCTRNQVAGSGPKMRKGRFGRGPWGCGHTSAGNLGTRTQSLFIAILLRVLCGAFWCPEVPKSLRYVDKISTGLVPTSAVSGCPGSRPRRTRAARSLSDCSQCT